MTLHDVLRAIVRGEAALLNSAKWVEEALAAIDGHEAAHAGPVAPGVEGYAPVSTASFSASAIPPAQVKT